jgi:hypothetical protein
VRDPETYEKFDEVILTHTCRDVAELKYGEELVAKTLEDPLVGEEAQAKLRYYPTTTREPRPGWAGSRRFSRTARPSAISASTAFARHRPRDGLRVDGAQHRHEGGSSKASASARARIRPPRSMWSRKAFVG